MLIGELLVALVFGLFIVWTFSRVFGTRGPWDNLIWFYLVVAIFAWSGGVWLVPFGPRWGGIGWFPIIFMAFVVSLALTAASPRRSRKGPMKKEQAMTDAESRAERRVAVDFFFWVQIICLLVFGFTRYTWYPRVG